MATKCVYGEVRAEFLYFVQSNSFKELYYRQYAQGVQG